MVWRNIHRRCDGKDIKRRKYYYDKGIKVCDRWGVFKNFLADMGRRPSALYSIDRKNGNKGYYKNNCRWATDKEQANNQSSNKRYYYKGKTLPVREWAKITGIKWQTIAGRLWRKWSIEDSLERNVRGSKKFQAKAPQRKQQTQNN